MTPGRGHISTRARAHSAKRIAESIRSRVSARRSLPRRKNGAFISAYSSRRARQLNSTRRAQQITR